MKSYICMRIEITKPRENYINFLANVNYVLLLAFLVTIYLNIHTQSRDT